MDLESPTLAHKRIKSLGGYKMYKDSNPMNLKPKKQLSPLKLKSPRKKSHKPRQANSPGQSPADAPTAVDVDMEFFSSKKFANTMKTRNLDSPYNRNKTTLPKLPSQHRTLQGLPDIRQGSKQQESPSSLF